MSAVRLLAVTIAFLGGSGPHVRVSRDLRQMRRCGIRLRLAREHDSACRSRRSRWRMNHAVARPVRVASLPRKGPGPIRVAPFAV